MNCKPGDMAIIRSAPDLPPLARGVIVEVLRACTEGHAASWECHSQRPIPANNGWFARDVTDFCVADVYLRRINGESDDVTIDQEEELIA